MAVLGALALVAAVAALGAAAWRWAGRLGARGLERVVAAAPLAAAVAGIETLLLGLAGLGGNAVALTLAAVATWGATTAWTERPPGAAARLRMPRGRRLLAGGALGGAALVWLAWLIKHPGLGIDPLTYHLPESVIWTQTGHPGAVELLQYEFPQGDYPVTNELLVAWTTGITHGFGAALLWTPAIALLAIAAGWLALRAAGADRLVGAWALAAVLLSPVAVTQLIGPHTDLPALAWLWCAGALVLCARSRPALLAPGLTAAALALGTKTTPAALLVVLVVWAGWTQRARLRHVARPLALGAALGAGAGGVWYGRNLLVHGSPLYPFKAAPWGDPMPAFLARLDVSFLQRPGETLDRNGAAYLDAVAGGFLVLALGLVVPLMLRGRRGALAVAAVTLLGVGFWTVAPFTGAAPDPALDLSATTIRYLLPTIGVAALALALAARRAPDGVRAGLVAVLALGCLWSVRSAQGLSVLAIPSTATLLVGAGLGAVLAAGWRRLTAHPAVDLRHPPAAWAARTARTAWAAAGLGAVVLVVGAGHGFARRQAGAPWLASAGVVTWAANQPAWQDDGFPVAFAPQLLAPLAGERLQHDIALIPAAEDCAAVRARAARGWVVVGTFPFADRREPFSAPGCLQDAEPLYRDGSYAVFGPAQTATRSNARATAAGSSTRKKSSGVIAAARGSGAPARERVSRAS